MEIRLKYSNYDNNEFKSIGTRTLNQTIEIFNNFPWEVEINKIQDLVENISYPIIKLLKDNGEYLEINGFNNNDNIFFNAKIKYKKRISRIITGLKLNKTEILNLITYFYNKETETVLNLLKSNKYVPNSVFFDFLIYNSKNKDKLININPNAPRNYKYSYKLFRTIGKMIFSLIFLFVPVITYIFTIVQNKEVSLLLIIAFQIAMLMFALPGIILANNHIRKSKNLKLYFQKNNNKFSVIQNGIKKILDKEDIKMIKKHKSSMSFRTPWGMFEYWEIEMTDNTKINISNLIIDDIDFMKFFGPITIDDDSKFLPLI